MFSGATYFILFFSLSYLGWIMRRGGILNRGNGSSTWCRGRARARARQTSIIGARKNQGRRRRWRAIAASLISNYAIARDGDEPRLSFETVRARFPCKPAITSASRWVNFQLAQCALLWTSLCIPRTHTNVQATYYMCVYIFVINWIMKSVNEIYRTLSSFWK